MTTTHLVQIHARRLVTGRWTAFATSTEAEAFRAACIDAVRKCSPSAVVCADWRAASSVAPDIARILQATLRGVDAHLERSAILLSPGQTIFNLQAEQIIREAASPNRAIFRDSRSLLNWLAEVLTPDLRETAARFLAGVDRPQQ